MAINIGKTREVCWDEYLIGKKEDITLKMHEPVRKNSVMTLDQKWEGTKCGYMSIVKVGDIYRLYYRASNSYGSEVDFTSFHDGDFERRESFCVAYSLDGKKFVRPNIGEWEILGNKDNNVVYRYLDQPVVDNFSVFYDENPACPPDEKFKALVPFDHGQFDYVNPGKREAGGEYGYLCYMTSPDGIHFNYGDKLPLHGTFDTFNVLFWDKKTEQYFIYSRNFHDGYTKAPKEKELRFQKNVRDVRVSTSKDFKTWTEHGVIDFGDGAEDYPLYTNGITKYYRSENMFWGMPTRYIERDCDSNNFKYLKLHTLDRMECIEKKNRAGYCFTDAVLVTSRDGLHFNRTDEAFITPGPQNGYNWCYGNCYHAYGLIQTESDIPGEPDEMSFYTTTEVGTRLLDVVRYSIRLDGFFSFHGDYAGGKLLTKPIIFDGDKLSINFETSARGHIRINLCDVDGNELEGYDSKKIFGNMVDRNVDFEKPLSELSGKEIRMKIEILDGDLYSFIFE